MLAQAADEKVVSESFQLDFSPITVQPATDPRLGTLQAPNIVLPDNRQQVDTSKRARDREDSAFKRPRRWGVQLQRNAIADTGDRFFIHPSHPSRVPTNGTAAWWPNTRRTIRPVVGVEPTFQQSMLKPNASSIPQLLADY
ncbi:hypothetical protein SARC_13258 [Sphaeroforma arctica JP610]|uniref:Uncharacterized protein n=1 Tax=Sphaeroforma arctica JP610 TaxID=667725 RepID=A0A0L0FBU1_9EUKA|nr:hypothetical protein SARC_13258 [Sphaeroforma arctica JP610]KNC74189.1 hypothetical protein SARC_13258 [Sphaeroforma arctica JP610]|eukprot:XP_014148091.1 hypothetical protein SARC_13258 [Sphaeroforma arctica JP610]